MATNTPRLNLYMTADDGSEPLNVATDINDNLEKIDASIGFVPALESTPPATPYNGMARYNTDTGRASFWRSGTSSWVQLLSAGVSFANDLLVGTANKLGIGTTTPGAIIDAVITSITANPLLRFRQTSESFPRLQIDSDGIKLGGGTVAPEVRIYRPTTNQISVEGSVAMNSTLSVTGTTALSDLNVSGNINLGGSFTTDVDINGTLTVDTAISGTGIGVTNSLRRTSDLARANTATVAVDSAFDYPLEANCTYFVEMFLVFAGLNTADFRCAWGVPTGATGPRWCLGMPATPTDASSTAVSTNTTGFTSDFIYGTQTATAYAGAHEMLTIVTSSTAGTLQFKWAQGSSSSTASTLRAGSIMRVRKVA